MASFEKQLRIILSLEDKFSKEADKAAGSLKSLSSNLTSLGTQMTAAITVPLTAAAAAGVKLATDLDASMRNIQSLTKQTDDSLAILSDQFIALSQDITKTTDSADNLAKGYYQLISSGIDAADAMSVLEVATKAASAGLTTTEVAVEGITGVLNAYGLEASEAARISDIMFETVNRGVVTFEQLNGALGNITGLASQVGVDFEEIAAAVATMTKQNIDASTATTNLSGIISAMIKPTSEMQAAIKAMGYESGSAMLETLGLAGTLQKIQQYTGGSSEQMAKLFGDVRALRGALALTGEGATMFAEDLQAMGASSGATQAAFAEQMKSFDAAFKNFQNVLNAFLMDIGTTIMPVIMMILDGLKLLMQGFMSLPEPVKQVIIVLGALLAVIGPILLIAGQLAAAWSALIVVFPTLATVSIPALIAGFTALLAPIMPIVVALGLLYAAYQTNFLGIRGVIDSAVGFIVENLKKAWTSLQQLGQILSTVWSEMNQKATTALSQLGRLIWEALKGVVKVAMDLGNAIMQGLLKGMASMAIDLVGFVFGLSKDLTNAVKQAFGIASPSKVMAKMGEQVVAGFHKGIEGMGGIGVTVPSVGQMPQVSGAALATSGASAGGGNVSQVFNIYAAPGSTDAQVRDIAKKLGKAAKRRGAKGF